MAKLVHFLATNVKLTQNIDIRINFK
jgi:hypothetical protein